MTDGAFDPTTGKRWCRCDHCQGTAPTINQLQVATHDIFSRVATPFSSRSARAEFRRLWDSALNADAEKRKARK